MRLTRFRWTVSSAIGMSSRVPVCLPCPGVLSSRGNRLLSLLFKFVDRFTLIVPCRLMTAPVGKRRALTGGSGLGGSGRDCGCQPIGGILGGMCEYVWAEVVLCPRVNFGLPVLRKRRFWVGWLRA